MLRKVANQLADSKLSQGISHSKRKHKHSINRPAYSEGLNKRQPRQLSNKLYCYDQFRRKSEPHLFIISIMLVLLSCLFYSFYALFHSPHKKDRPALSRAGRSFFGSIIYGTDESELILQSHFHFRY